jgi:zinc transporter ZupT
MAGPAVLPVTASSFVVFALLGLVVRLFFTDDSLRDAAVFALGVGVGFAAVAGLWALLV